MRTMIAGALLLTSMAACVTDESEDLSTQTEDLYGLGTAALRWGTTSGANIPVCWDDPDSFPNLQATARSILRETWESYANISFIGNKPAEPFGGAWPACSAITGRKIHVAFSTDIDFRGLSSPGPGSDTTVTLISAGAAGVNAARFRYEVIHEFGHALGFTHEMQRPDNFTSVNAIIQCPAPSAAEGGQYQRVTGGVYLTPSYDVNSIMNYCTQAVGWQQDLSVGDITGVRAAYGRRDVKGGLYRIDASNQLYWYRHDGRTNGSFSWATGSGNVVGTGWSFKQLFSGGDSMGVLYSIDANNILTWRRHDGRVDGGFRWSPGSGSIVSYDWNVTSVFGAGGGVIYGITPYVPAHYDSPTSGLIPASGGELKWYRHDGWQTGRNTWAQRSGAVVGNRWDGLQKVFSGGNDIIYAVTAVVPARYDVVTGRNIPASGGELKWYRHTGQVDGTFRWAANSGATIGTGWGNFKRLFSGGDGVIYALDNSDRLIWYKHTGRDAGTFSWAPGSGTPVGFGWASQHLVGDD